MDITSVIHGAAILERAAADGNMATGDEPPVAKKARYVFTIREGIWLLTP